jgi:hypothetical protein
MEVSAELVCIRGKWTTGCCSAGSRTRTNWTRCMTRSCAGSLIFT